MNLTETGKKIAKYLAEKRIRVVFAESCTAGLVSASLARSAGISECHCGSAVVYRNKTKENWLGISQVDILRYGAVSQAVAQQMAVNVLAHTEEADFSASITGHLGPNAPDAQDGVVYIGIARRNKGQAVILCVERHQLRERTRLRRQKEAAELVLRVLWESLQETRF